MTESSGLYAPIFATYDMQDLHDTKRYHETYAESFDFIALRIIVAVTIRQFELDSFYFVRTFEPGPASRFIKDIRSILIRNRRCGSLAVRLIAKTCDDAELSDNEFIEIFIERYSNPLNSLLHIADDQLASLEAYTGGKFLL